MKKFICFVLSLCLFISLFSSCQDNQISEKSENKINIISTVFPGYDWIKNILGKNVENVNTSLLLDDGVDLHSFQPSVDDIIRISECDMFIYVGGESDEWVEDALRQRKNQNMIIVNLMEILSDRLKIQEEIDCMQSTHNHTENKEEFDEHVWLSLNNAKTICKYLCEKMILLDPGNKELYVQNTENYVNKLTNLDNDFKLYVENSKNKAVIFADRFPFRYFTNDYSINYFAAFNGCSSESEASFETIKFLSQKVDELNLCCVMILEDGQDKIAKTIISNTKNKNQSVLTLDSMQSTTLQEAENGSTYLSIMQKNIDVFKEALK